MDSSNTSPSSLVALARTARDKGMINLYPTQGLEHPTELLPFQEESNHRGNLRPREVSYRRLYSQPADEFHHRHFHASQTKRHDSAGTGISATSGTCEQSWPRDHSRPSGLDQRANLAKSTWLVVPIYSF